MGPSGKMYVFVRRFLIEHSDCGNKVAPRAPHKDGGKLGSFGR